MTDLAFYFPTWRTINVYFNQLKARGPGNDLCHSPYTVDVEGIARDGIFAHFDTLSHGVLVQNVTDDPEFAGLASPNEAFPGRIRTGDINADGYTDIIASIKFNSGKTDTLILVNNDNGGFNVQGTDYDSISEFSKNSVLATMADVDENGILDVLLVVESTTATPRFVVKTIYNNIVQDSFYLKAVIVNADSSQKYYGDASIGPAFRCVVTDLKDDQFVIVGNHAIVSRLHSEPVDSKRLRSAADELRVHGNRSQQQLHRAVHSEPRLAGKLPPRDLPGKF